MPVDYKTDELMVFRRNPYYWKVDESGKQLPYLNEVIFEKAATGVIRTAKVMAGAADHTNVENPSTYREVATRAHDPERGVPPGVGPRDAGLLAAGQPVAQLRRHRRPRARSCASCSASPSSAAR